MARVTAGNVNLVVESVEGVGVGALPPDELLARHQGPELVVVLGPALVVDTAHQPRPPRSDGAHQVLPPSRAPALDSSEELSLGEPGGEGSGGEGSAPGGAGGGTEGDPGHHLQWRSKNSLRNFYLLPQFCLTLLGEDIFLLIIGKCL